MSVEEKKNIYKKEGKIFLFTDCFLKTEEHCNISASMEIRSVWILPA